MTTLKENDEVSLIEGEYHGRFRVVSPTNITQSSSSNGEFILVALIEPLDTVAFSAFLFEKAAIDTSDIPLPFHICIEPNRLQLT